MSKQHHHYLTAASVRPNKKSLRAHQRRRDPETGLFVSGSSRVSEPLPPGVTLVPPTPNTKRRLAAKAVTASREKDKLQRTSKDGKTYSLSMGAHGICRIDTGSNQTPFLKRIAGSVSIDCEPGEQEATIVDNLENNNDAFYDGNVGNDMDWCPPECVDTSGIPDPKPKKASDSRRRYKETVAEHWTKLIDGADSFVDAFLHAEADFFHRRNVPLSTASTFECSCAVSGRNAKLITCVSIEGEQGHRIAMHTFYFQKYSLIHWADQHDISFAYYPSCSPLAIQLIRRGFFPATPIAPTVAFSMSLLKFYIDISTVSKVPVQAFSMALVPSLQNKGHHFSKRAPFLQQIQFLLPWVDKILRKIDRKLWGVIDSSPPSEVLQSAFRL
jgi:hypothetical protein